MNKRTSKIYDTLDRTWPPRSVHVECSECGEVLFHVDEETDSEVQRKYSGAMYTASAIELDCQKHRNRTDHDSFDVDIIPFTRVERQIDVDITVGGGEDDG